MTNTRGDHQGVDPARTIRRRTAVLAASAGVLGALRPGLAAAAPSYTTIPRLPGEVARTDTRVTRLGKKPYECVDVVVNGDQARLFVPHATPPSLRTANGMTWFYHSNGSTHTSLDGAYKYGAELVVDRDCICICPTFGGPSTWTTPVAVDRQQDWSRYVTSVWRIAVSFARANSGGGPLMIWAYANRMLPYQRGMYLANAAYDMEDLFARDPGRIGPPYGNDPARVRAANPARLSQSMWTGTRLKTVLSTLDFIVPPTEHGAALADTAQPVATNVQTRYHYEGHVVPSWTQQDMVNTFAAWM